MNLIHKEFLIALANGREVEYKNGDEWQKIWQGNTLAVFENELIELRIKPKTVTISYEIPMQFVPEVGENYWYTEPAYQSCVDCTENTDSSVDERIIDLGVYRTEKEAIQALKAQEAAVAKLLEGAK